MKKDNDFIEKEELEEINEKLKKNENITLPQSLKMDSIKEKIKDVPQTDYTDILKEAEDNKPIKRSKKQTAFKWVSVAAVFAIVFTSLMIAKPFSKRNPQLKPNENSEGIASSKDDYSEIEKLFIDYSKKYKKYMTYTNITNGIIGDNAENESKPESNLNTNTQDGLGDGSDRRYGETNTQVSGVKEADIIKNDGKYLYCVGNKADWDKYYAEYDSYISSLNEDGLAKTTKNEAEQTTPQYDPNGEAKEKPSKNINKVTEKPCLDYKAVIDIFEPSKDGKINKKSRIDIKADKNDVFGMTINEIYVTGNRLIAIIDCELNKTEKESQKEPQIYNGPMVSGSIVCGTDFIRNTNTLTLVICYDITNRESPKESFRFYQDGVYTSSRLIDNSFILLTNYGVNLAIDEENVKNNCIPKIGEDYNNMARVPLKDVQIMDEITDSQYLVATNMNIEDKNSMKTEAVLGGGTNVYCSRDNLYVTSAEYNKYDLNSKVFGDGGLKTYIYKFDIKNYGVKFLCKASVDGNALNQFSIDEYKDNLRIATTVGDFSTGISNSLYILDSNLKEVGSLKGIAKDEHIESVRFSGDVGYVVTFKQVDPLFVIDLKEPTKPQIIGELKIPGFSSYLHPITEKLVLGLGVGGDENGADGSVKLSLFDVSDPKKPLECSTLSLKTTSSYGRITSYRSDALFDHKALCYDSKNKIIYIPYSKYSEKLVSNTGNYELNQEGGILKIKVDTQNKKLINEGFFVGENKGGNSIIGFNRVTYIDNIIFAYSDYQSYLCSFNESTKNQIDMITVV